MRIDSFRVVPALPERLRRLEDLAYNLVWSWDEEIRAVFPRIDRELWERSGQNPVLLLGTLPQQRLAELAEDDGFLSLFDRTVARLDAYLSERTWWQRRYQEHPRIAYFSAEYGITECLPIYSGGLGVLAAHHLKSASDLGVPLVGVGLLILSLQMMDQASEPLREHDAQRGLARGGRAGNDDQFWLHPAASFP